MFKTIISILAGIIIGAIATFLVVTNTYNKIPEINDLNGTYNVTSSGTNTTSIITLENGDFKQKTSTNKDYTGKIDFYKSSDKTYLILQSTTSENVFLFEYNTTDKGFILKRLAKGGKTLQTNTYVKE